MSTQRDEITLYSLDYPISSQFNDKELCVHKLVLKWATRTPDSIAIEAIGRPSLTYKRLYNFIEHVVERLNEMGLGRNDRVAVVLPNGPEMAVTFLAVSSGSTCAPLNPAYKTSEFEFFLSDLNAKALIIQSGLDSPAISVAENLGVQVIQLSSTSKAEAGTFTLSGENRKTPVSSGLAKPDDIALVLHTSGTTSRPKLVPLSHINICTSARNIVKTLRLTTDDRCLNVMPLFHIHGLIGATLSSISSGATVICTPGFYAPRFLEWLEIFCPTWFSAVPTMHQAILFRLNKVKEKIANSKLRFIRSSSSALPPQIMSEMEKTFDVPVIESYGMTEASHQIASNPLPPQRRMAGSVGLAAGPEISIMDDEGNLLPHGEVGEIVIRGPNVTKGYENNLIANKKSYTNDWFRTGDQGYFDKKGCLFITDRIKEIINRGGEKISPREVDEVLMDHPSIAQVVSFAMPHARLGEDVAAAIVLHKDSSISEWDIQKFAAERLADYKIPRRILILDEIPKGPTGKMQRIGLAEKLGLTLREEKYSTDYKPPNTSTEKLLVEIWTQILEVDHVGVSDNYFELGGDSILAGQIINEIGKALDIKNIPLVIFLHAPNVEKMAHILDNGEISFPPASLVAIQDNGEKTPMFCVHACEGEVLFYSDLVHHLGPEQPFYALRAQGLDEIHDPLSSVEDMAAHYLSEIQALRPNGPYILGGAGVGGIIAYEMAQRLLSQGNEIDALILLDTRPPDTHKLKQKHSKNFDYYRQQIEFLKKHGMLFNVLALYIRARAHWIYRQIAGLLIPRYKVWNHTERAIKKYTLKEYQGRILLFTPEELRGPYSPGPDIELWDKLSGGRLKIFKVPGKHLEIFKEPNVKVLAGYIRKSLDEITVQQKV